MKVLLANIGTAGDVFPFAGLGAALRARGHEAVLLGPESFAGLARTHGLGFAPLLPAEEERVLADPVFWHPLRGALVAARWGARLFEGLYRSIARQIEPGRTVVCAGTGVLGARFAEERLEAPLASILLQPALIPSAHLSPVLPFLPAGVAERLPRPLRGLLWRSIDRFGAWLVSPELNRLRRDLGLVPVRRLLSWWLSPRLVLGLFPAWYGPPQPDWPPQVRLVGFPRFVGGAGGLPPEAESFLADGEPPLIFTFGTGMRQTRVRFTKAIEAARLLGRRAVLLSRFPEGLPAQLPAHVRAFDFLPLSLLLPRAAAIVHHGGIGTTAEAMAAGVPQLVIPQAWDQPDNAERVRRLGVGDRLRPGAPAGAIARRVEALLAASDVARRCRETAGRFEGDALARGCELVEALLPGASSPARSAGALGERA